MKKNTRSKKINGYKFFEKTSIYNEGVLGLTVYKASCHVPSPEHDEFSVGQIQTRLGLAVCQAP
jgi:hypothetical protein